MKITKEEDYAVLLIHALTLPRQKPYLPLVDVARIYKLSEFFLKKVAKKLREAKILRSKEGLKGGYTLLKPAHTLSYGEILTAVSGEIDISPCCPTCHKENCKQRKTWDFLNKAVSDLLNSVKFNAF